MKPFCSQVNREEWLNLAEAQADLSHSWHFPHAPQQAGSSSHGLSTPPSINILAKLPFPNVETTVPQILKNKTSLIDVEESREDTCREGGGQVLTKDTKDLCPFSVSECDGLH